MYFFGKTLQDFTNDLDGVSNQEIYSPFSNCIYQCLLYAVIIYHIYYCCFNIVTFVIIIVSMSVIYLSVSYLYIYLGPQ